MRSRYTPNQKEHGKVVFQYSGGHGYRSLAKYFGETTMQALRVFTHTETNKAAIEATTVLFEGSVYDGDGAAYQKLLVWVKMHGGEGIDRLTYWWAMPKRVRLSNEGYGLSWDDVLNTAGKEAA